jgi:TolA-binding protein
MRFLPVATPQSDPPFTEKENNMFKLRAVRPLLVVIGMSTFAAGMSASAAESAPAPDSTWQQNHPRRAEVNARLARQDARIHDEVKEGDMSKAKAARLHQQDRQIRQEERDMASQNGGHITRQEQKTLNQQENKVSHEIGK